MVPFSNRIVGEFYFTIYKAAKREPRLTIKQVSQRLQVDPSTLWRWERDGYLIPTRLGRKVLYNESDIIAIEEGRV